MEKQPLTTIERVARRMYQAAITGRLLAPDWEALRPDTHMYWISLAMEIRQIFEYEGTEHDPSMEGKKPVKDEHAASTGPQPYRVPNGVIYVEGYLSTRREQETASNVKRPEFIPAGPKVQYLKETEIRAVPEKKEPEKAEKIKPTFEELVEKAGDPGTTVLAANPDLLRPSLPRKMCQTFGKWWEKTWG